MRHIRSFDSDDISVRCHLRSSTQVDLDVRTCLTILLFLIKKFYMFLSLARVAKYKALISNVHSRLDDDSWCRLSHSSSCESGASTLVLSSELSSSIVSCCCPSSISECCCMLIPSFGPPPFGQKHAYPNCEIPAGCEQRPGRVDTISISFSRSLNFGF